MRRMANGMGTTVARAVVGVLLAIGMTTQAFALQAPAGQEGFVPLDQLPPADQLPAAPLLVTAYAFIWVAVFFYVWTLWRRLGRVERDLAALGRRAPERGRGR
ncbi:MAG: CcmD family protein [Acidobacteriota bacterium]